MLDEVKSIETQLKQILYGCVEHVQATKAALYLSASHDLNEKTYELVTSYQYNASGRHVVTANDDLVDQLAVKRGSFFVNSLASDLRFAEILFRQGNDRLLATPLFSRGRLIGFIDMRDKAGKKPFEAPDVDAATRIADEIMRVLAQNQLFGVAAIALVEDRAPAVSTATQPQRIPTPPPPPRAVDAGQVFSPEAVHSIRSARQYVSKRQMGSDAPRRLIGETELEGVRLLLPAALAIPGAVLAGFSAIGHVGNPQTIVSIAMVTEDALEMLQNHLQSWAEKTGQRVTVPARPQLVYPFGLQVIPITAGGISSILSAPVNPQSVEGLVLTVAFERMPEAEAKRSLQMFLRQIEQSVDSAIAATSGRNDRQTIAERLLEPDFKRFPELAQHCRDVATVAERFARLLNLAPSLVETIRVAALVHDVGLRLLDYDRIYNRANLSPEEIRGLAEHPVLGAALVEPLLGQEVAQAVLRHHERVDGTGYPSRLTGPQIPLAAKIIHIADAWVAMTGRQLYRAPISAAEATAHLREAAGTQFDADLVASFVESLREITE